MPFVRNTDGTVIEVGTDAIFADAAGQTPLNIPTGPVFTSDDIERARQQEKDKLYGRIEDLQASLTTLTEQVGGLSAEQQREKAALQQEKERLEAEARRQEEQGLDATDLIERRTQEWEQTLNETRSSLEQRLEEEKQARLQAEAIAAKERQFNDVREHISAQVQANSDKIAPQLIGWITGNSKEEVDANVARAIETTNEILAEFQQLQGQQVPDPNQQFIQEPQQQFVPPAPPQQPGVTPFAGPANLDPAGQQSQQLTAEQIANMDMGDYAKLRGRLGIGGQNNARGLFG